MEIKDVNRQIYQPRRDERSKVAPKGNCLCFDCFKIAKKNTQIQLPRLSLEETEEEELERERQFLELIESDSEDEKMK